MSRLVRLRSVTFKAMKADKHLERQWSLMASLVKRDITQRYRGSIFGMVWAFLLPLMLLAVYSFVFRMVFTAKWDQLSNTATGSTSVALFNMLPDGLHFAANLFIGLIVFSIFAEVIGRSPKLILEQPHLVRRVVFPLPLLGAVLTVSAIANALFQWVVLVVALLLGAVVFPSLQSGSASGSVFVAIDASWLQWAVLQVPLSLVVLLCLVPLLLGFTWTLSALGAYFRDLSYLTPPLMSMLMFLGPVFYPTSSLPEPYRGWVVMNPLTIIAEQLRFVLMQGTAPNWSQLCAYTMVGIVFAMFGLWFFRRVQAGFSDVI